jgi:phosphate transport system permease protein
MLNSKISPHLRQEASLIWVLWGTALLSSAILVLIILFLIRETVPIVQQLGISRFFTDPGWHPTDDQFNLMPMLWGSLLVTTVAVLLATPLGILGAVFCQYYAPIQLANFYRQIIQLLAGIPSVVYGFWGLVVLVPIIGRIHAPGPSWLAGSLILTLMIVPTLTLVADSSLGAVSPSYLQSCAALGLGKWATIYGVVLPAAKSGLCTGIFLSAGRAIGETMAVLMVSGNVVQVPHSIFDPVRTLTANIALEMAYATDHHRAALFVSGSILMGMVLLLVIIGKSVYQEHHYE